LTRRIRPEFPLLLLILVGYFIIGGLYATRTPAWQVPDEPAHYNYIAQLSAFQLPVIEDGDWNNQYLEDLKRDGFDPATIAGSLFTIQYEDHQPPLYYTLATPVFIATNGNLISLRLVSLVIGGLVVLTAFAVIYRIFPQQPYLAVGTAAFVAFLPQHLAMMSGVNNDCLIELLVGLSLYVCVGFLKADPERIVPRAITLGFLLGLAFITKVTGYALIFIVIATILLRANRERWTPTRTLGVLMIIAIPAVLIGGAWWLRNSEVYGFPDILGLRRHDAVVIGQARTADQIALKGLGLYLSDGLQTTFQSFWGQFGWMGVVLPRNIITALVIFNSFALMGAGVAFVQFRALVSRVQVEAMLVLAFTALLALGLFIYYNLSFTQFQGRYLFTALIPFGFFFSAALTGWASLVQNKAARWALIGGFGVVLAGFAVYALFRVLVPALPVFT
jgi:4-amino-4-deoxy-L-arabinose transferase-like glycosyltransferase